MRKPGTLPYRWIKEMRNCKRNAWLMWIFFGSVTKSSSQRSIKWRSTGKRWIFFTMFCTEDNKIKTKNGHQWFQYENGIKRYVAKGNWITTCTTSSVRPISSHFIWWPHSEHFQRRATPSSSPLPEDVTAGSSYGNTQPVVHERQRIALANVPNSVGSWHRRQRQIKCFLIIISKVIFN